MAEKDFKHWIIFLIAMSIGSAFGVPTGDTILDVLNIDKAGAPHVIANIVASVIIGMATYAIIDRIWRREKN